MQAELDKVKKDAFAKNRLNQLNEDKLSAQNIQIKKLFEEVSQLNERLRKAKEENVRMTNQKRMTESMIVGHEEETRLLRNKELMAQEEVFREIDGLRAEVKGLKAKRNDLEAEKGQKESEIHGLKIQLEKLRMENTELRMARKTAEAQFGATKESFVGMEPVMMRNEVLLGPREARDGSNNQKKTCIDDLVHMIKTFKADSGSGRRTGAI